MDLAISEFHIGIPSVSLSTYASTLRVQSLPAGFGLLAGKPFQGYSSDAVPSKVYDTTPSLTDVMQSYRAEVAAAPHSGELRADNRSRLRRWWEDDILYNLKSRKPLIADPLASHEVQIAGKSYIISDMNPNAGIGTEMLGNLYHRSPLGGLIENSAQMAYDPIRKVGDSAVSTYQTVANIPQSPTSQYFVYDGSQLSMTFDNTQ